VTLMSDSPPLRLALDFASNWEIRGGVWRYGIELSRALVTLVGPENVVLPCFDHLPDDRVEELQATGATLVSTAWSRRFDHLDSLLQRRGRFVPWKHVLPWIYTPRRRQRLFEKTLGDVEVYHALLACRGQPRAGATVGTIHDLIPLLHAEAAGFARDRFLAMVEDHRRWAELVIVPSQATRSDLIEHLQFPADRIRVVYHGIDHARFHVRVPYASTLLQQHQLQPGQYLLYIGALEKRKNIERLVTAYLQAVGDRRDIPLVLSGSVIHEMPALQQALADGTNRVRHIGYVGDADLPGLYRGARALLHVALAEGFGFTPLEAMACGTPVVASKQTATGEVVNEGGLLVDAYSVEEIAGAIRRVMSNDALHDDLARRGMQRAKAFTWSRCAEQTLEVYREAHQSWGAR
jgi:glycosyltransferase involved in cell wall biosynthesis